VSNAPASAYPSAALVLLAAIAFYWFVVRGLNSTTGLVVLAIPTVVLAVGWARALSRKA
jgi:ABC-type spermidine/putrescine transport system permease subunit II